MIIDTHQHFWEPKTHRAKAPEDYKLQASGEGITGTILLGDGEMPFNLAVNEPLIVGVVGRVAVNRPEFTPQLDKCSANPLFRGIRCKGRDLEDIDRTSFIADMEYLAGRDLYLDLYRFCGGGEALTDVYFNGVKALSDYFGNENSFAGFEKLAARVPQLRILISHVAHCPVDGKALSDTWRERIKRIAAHPNVFMKVSGLMERFVRTDYERVPDTLSYYRPLLDVLWECFGEDRLVYGSNWPVCEHVGDFIGNGLRIVRPFFAAKGEEAYTKFLWKNSQRIVKWTPRLPSQR